MIQHGYEAAWEQAPLQLDSFALLSGLLRSVLDCFVQCRLALLGSGETSLVFQLSQGDSAFNLQWKRKVCFPSQRGDDSYRQMPLLLVSDWSDLMQIRIPSLHSLIGPKGIVVIGQDRTL